MLLDSKVSNGLFLSAILSDSDKERPIAVLPALDNLDFGTRRKRLSAGVFGIEASLSRIRLALNHDLALIGRQE